MNVRQFKNTLTSRQSFFVQYELTGSSQMYMSVRDHSSVGCQVSIGDTQEITNSNGTTESGNTLFTVDPGALRLLRPRKTMESIQDSSSRVFEWAQRSLSGNEEARTELVQHLFSKFRALLAEQLHSSGVSWTQKFEELLEVSAETLATELDSQYSGTAQQILETAGRWIRDRLLDFALRQAQQPAGSLEETLQIYGNDESTTPSTGSTALRKPSSLVDWVRFHEGINELPHREQQVILLRWYAGISAAEAALLLRVDRHEIDRRWMAARILIGRQLIKQTS